ncbi:helix-turn-helix domain-containing protein [Kitasatospora sp. NPDC051170]|uniref:helix-turn-helix domain-containing protein n=1 Tax=Kitasatospora sp. NPDC051170 TaxID=3364056 RepID=UPI0037AC4E1F
MSVGTEEIARVGGTAARDRFEHWREVVRLGWDSEVTSAHAEDFTAEVRRSELGLATVLGTSFPSARFRRTERMIRCSDNEQYHLGLLTRGSQAIAHGRDRTETCGPGDLILLDTRLPFDDRYFGAPGPDGKGTAVTGVCIDVPVSLLAVPPRHLRHLLGRRLSGSEGTGALLAEFILGLDRQAPALLPAAAARLGEVAVDLVSAWLASELDAEHTVSPDARARATVETVRSFIRRNLHDPELTPSTIAAAHHISVSHLHRLFAEHLPGRTVAALIRSQRLAKAHRELADPALRTLPVHAIATRCGMPRASDFGRAFKAAYGLTPREHRHRALGESR